MTFSIATILGTGAMGVAEDLRYFAEGTPQSFLRTWHLQPISMFAGSLVFVAVLYLLQRLNDRENALRYAYPYLVLAGFLGTNLKLRFDLVWVGFVAVGCVTWSVLQVRLRRNERSTPVRL